MNDEELRKRARSYILTIDPSMAGASQREMDQRIQLYFRGYRDAEAMTNGTRAENEKLRSAMAFVAEYLKEKL